MKRLLYISPFAEADLEQAALWLDEQSAGLGDRLYEDFEEALSRIDSAPLNYRQVHLNARSILMKTFRYHVFYRVFPDCINVVAVVHAHRHPRVWKKALRERT